MRMLDFKAYLNTHMIRYKHTLLEINKKNSP